MTTKTTTRPDIDTGVWTLDPAHTRIGFSAKHLMVSRVRGSFKSFQAEIEVAEDLSDSAIQVTIDADSIDTGSPDRDGHLRSADFLAVDEYPKIEFTSKEISRQGERFLVTGDLVIRGVARPVALEASYEGTAIDPWGNSHVAFSAKTTINRENWGLVWNAPLEGGGWLVSKEIVLEVEGQLIRPS